MQTMRLNRTMACPECSVPVKPFVMGPLGEDAKGRKTIRVKCPRPECENVFQAYDDDKE